MKTTPTPSPSELSAVMIRWRDATSLAGWVHADDGKAMEPQVIITIGFLIAGTPNHYTLARGRTIGEDKGDVVMDPLVIPYGCVESLTYLIAGLDKPEEKDAEVSSGTEGITGMGEDRGVAKNCIIDLDTAQRAANTHYHIPPIPSVVVQLEKTLAAAKELEGQSFVDKQSHFVETLGGAEAARDLSPRSVEASDSSKEAPAIRGNMFKEQTEALEASGIVQVGFMRGCPLFLQDKGSEPARGILKKVDEFQTGDNRYGIF